MWGEVTRLQEKEKTLLQMLKLEREKRVRAEQLVEVEMMACHELEHRLHLEVKKRAISERESARKEGNMNMATLTEDDMEVSLMECYNHNYYMIIITDHACALTLTNIDFSVFLWVT